jgi:hypothetical protein
MQDEVQWARVRHAPLVTARRCKVRLWRRAVGDPSKVFIGTLLSSPVSERKSGAATSSRQQAAARWELIVSIGGDCVRQRSSASGQRGLKRQPTVVASALPARRTACGLDDGAAVRSSRSGLGEDATSNWV